MAQQRGKKAVINTTVAMLQEVVSVVCGFIVPRLILSAFGSTYNGLISSITQFLSCAVLLRAGIGGATRAALYRPIAEGNVDSINSIMAATNNFMKKVAAILLALIFGFACVYPFFVIDEFGWLFTFSLFIIIGISTFAESMFGITYLILLQADQKLYISSIMHIIVYILNTLTAVVLIEVGASIHVVKLGSALMFSLYPICLNIYVRKKYDLNLKVEPDNTAISQRWDAFFHQVANFVMNSTDVIVLTIFSTMTEVSVYSVYNLVVNGLKKLVLNFTNGLEAAFGNMMVTDNKTLLKKNFLSVEFLIYAVATVVYSATVVLFLDFVSVYTKGITDANYIRPLYMYIVVAGQFFNCVRQPYQLVVQAAGHYKQTKIGAIIEPILNISISVAVVFNFGLIGVAVGTLVAIIFRTAQYSIYVSKNLIQGTIYSALKNFIISIIEIVIIVFLVNLIPFGNISTYGQWIMKAVVTAIIAFVVVAMFSLIFFKDSFFWLINKMKGILKKG